LIGETSSDVFLVRASRNGDDGAFALLYEKYRRMVHAVVLSLVTPSDADDLVQDVFMTAMKKIGTLREEGAFGGWLAAIARNKAREYRRSAIELVEVPEIAGNPSQESEAEAHRALEAIRALPDAYRETLLMRLVEGMTGPEIAERSGLHPDSVRVNLHRGMKLLRESLSGRAQ
jgi:RNA polymerase sigma-70 factor (ECF subfamily)